MKKRKITIDQAYDLFFFLLAEGIRMGDLSKADEVAKMIKEAEARAEIQKIDKEIEKLQRRKDELLRKLSRGEDSE